MKPSKIFLQTFFKVCFLRLHKPVALRPRRPAAPAGQRRAGCDRHVSADGGDGEAGGAARSGGGEGSLLHLHQLPAACGGESQSDLDVVMLKKNVNDNL